MYINALAQTNTSLYDVLSPPSLSLGCDATSKFGIILAAKRGQEATARKSQEGGAQVQALDDYVHTPLMEAARFGHKAVVQLLLTTEGIDPDLQRDYGTTPLMLAAQYRQESAVELLLTTEGVNQDSKTLAETTPLFEAAREGNEGVVRLLLASERADLNSKSVFGDAPLSAAAAHGYEAAVKLLLDTECIDLDSKSKTLREAARNGHKGVIKLLFAEGADVDSADHDGRTTLS